MSEQNPTQKKPDDSKQIASSQKKVEPSAVAESTGAQTTDAEKANSAEQVSADKPQLIPEIIRGAKQLYDIDISVPLGAKPGVSKLAAILAGIKSKEQNLAFNRAIHKAVSIPHGFDGITRLQSEINELKGRIEKDLTAERTTRKEQEKQVASLTRDIQMLQQKEELAFLLSRVTPLAHEVLLSDHPLKRSFFSSAECPTFVVSMDIRRSTELMLKARKPELFAQFMTSVCDGLEAIIKKNYGVVDKFTGDGVLAFFPDFFTGTDAAFLAISTADEAHKLFATRYREHRQSFSTVLNDVGLGIGIDYGQVSLMHVAGGLTVVGTPVVYACRMGSAPAGKTYLNQPAYEKVSDRYSASCFISETELEIKHEGKVLAYDIRLTNKPFSPESPPWIEGQIAASAASEGPN